MRICNMKKILFFLFTIIATGHIAGQTPGYDPENPGDPAADGYSHNVSVSISPRKGGYVNKSSFKMVEGTTSMLHAYPNPGYKFVAWKQNGNILSSECSLKIDMGKEDLYYEALFAYNPQSPSDPGANFIDLYNGELIIDKFEPGNLVNAISVLLGNTDLSVVKSMKVIGRMEDYDWGFCYNLSEIETLDLARTSGCLSVPSYMLGKLSNLEKLILPSDIAIIEPNAMNDCGGVMEIQMYAIVPPDVNVASFIGLNDECVIKVPAESIELYKSNPFWSEFAILPLDENTGSISVDLPGDAVDGRYKNMNIVLKNSSSGQVIKYLISDRTSYSFPYLVTGIRYNLFITTATGSVLGSITDIDLAEETKYLKFENLKFPVSFTAVILTESEEDISDISSVRWTDEEGNYLGSGRVLEGVAEGDVINCEVFLDEEKSTGLIQPERQTVTADRTYNELRFVVRKRGTREIRGYVMNEGTRRPLAGVSVLATQDSGAKNVITNSMTTGLEGEFTVSVFDGLPVSLKISGDGYVSKEIGVEQQIGDQNIGEISLSVPVGPVVYVVATYQKCGEESPSDSYGDTSDIIVSIDTGIPDAVLNQLRIEKGVIHLPTDLADGRYDAVAKSMSGAFEPVSCPLIVEGGIGEMVIPIMEKGMMEVVMSSSENDRDIALLFNSGGNIVDICEFSNGAVMFKALDSGEYALVCSGESNRMRSVVNMTQIDNSDLIENKDYVKRSVTIYNGRKSIVNSFSIPYMENGKYSVLTDNASVTIGKKQVAIGQIITVRANVDIKKDSKVDNLEIMFHIPSECEFIGNSVMCGNSVAGYTIEDDRLVVELDSGIKLVRFCLKTKDAAECAVGADVRFSLNGESFVESISPGKFTVERLKIRVPEFTSRESIVVSGTAQAQSVIEVFDNNVRKAECRAFADGTWKTVMPLHKPYSFSKHSVYAKVTDKEGNETFTGSENCVVQKTLTGGQANNVEMIFYQPEMQKNVHVMFDHINGETSPGNYTMFTGQTFTFIADFGENSPNIVEKAFVYVYTLDNKVTRLSASYDANLDRWIATGVFYDANAPVNVTGRCISNDDLFPMDWEEVTEHYGDLDNIKFSLDADIQSLADSSEIFKDSFENENVSVDQLEKILLDRYGVDVSAIEPGNADMSSAEYEEILNMVPSFVESAADTKEEDEVIDLTSSHSRYGVKEFKYEDVEYVCETLTCEGLDMEDLSGKGYNLISTTDNAPVYCFISETETDYIDFVNNLRKHIYIKNKAGIKNRRLPAATYALTDVMQNQFFQRCADIIGSLLQEESILMQLSKSLEYSKKADLNNLLKQENLINRALAHNQYRLDSATDIFDKLRISNERRVLVNGLRQLEEKKQKVLIVDQRISRLLSAAYLIRDLHDYVVMIRDHGRRAFSLEVPPMCDKIVNPEAATRLLTERISKVRHEVFDFIFYQGLRKAVYMAANLYLAKIPLLGMAISFLEDYAEDIRKSSFERWTVTQLDRIESDIQYIIRRCNNDDDDDDDNDKDDEEKPEVMEQDEAEIPSPMAPSVKVAYDPSGFVFEGVPSNRVEGVKATVFFKDFTEDEYGNPLENAVEWDAREFGQDNPLFTDQNGQYAWDVPQGLWQVRFEKTGYETSFSEWLPVPPPQLEVNIAMTQLSQPEVAEVHVYSRAVTVEFDKYMLPELLTEDNIIVTCDGMPIRGVSKLLDLEKAYGSDTEEYAKGVRFEFPSAIRGREAQVSVSNRVKSYAGVRMQEPFVQTFDIEEEISSIVVVDTLNVEYGSAAMLTVRVLPESASAGKLLKVQSAEEGIASCGSKDIVLDDKGSTTISVEGIIPGVTAINFSLEGSRLNRIMTVNVTSKKQLEEVCIPVASLPSGEVEVGTEVYLFCDSPGAVIYYTVDGSCPCGPDALCYDGSPIVVTSDLELKVMAVIPGLSESRIITYRYTVKTSGIDTLNSDLLKIYPLPIKGTVYISNKGKSVEKVMVLDMTGRCVAEEHGPAEIISISLDRIPIGVYMFVVWGEDKRYVKKVVKM